MKNNRFKALLVGLSLMGVIHHADAQLYSFSENGNDYATLDISQVGTSNVYDFTLNLLEVNGAGNYDFIDQIFFTPTSTVGTVSALTLIDVAPNTTTANTTITTDGVGTSDEDGINYDWSIIFDDGSSANGNNARSALQLEELESASWSVAYNTQPVFANIGVTLRNNGQGNPQDIIVASVPEPETYAMFLAGLGLLGFTARRRKNT